jgi:putative flippase GtrA
MDNKPENTETQAPKKENFLTRLDNSASRKIPELWKFIKFTVMGGLSSAVELGVFYVFLALFKNVTVLPGFLLNFYDFIGKTAEEGHTLACTFYAFVCSTFVGYAIAFVLNRKATFKADSNVALSTFLYILMVVFTIIMNGILGPIISGLLGKIIKPGAILDGLSKVIGMLIPSVWTYPLNRFVIHRHKKVKEAA